MPLGEEIKRLRNAAGMTQVQLANAVGISQGFLAQLELGVRTGIGADVLYKLCDALGVKCDHFRSFIAQGGEAEEKPKKPRKKT